MLPIIPTPKSIHNTGARFLHKATIADTDCCRNETNVFLEYMSRLGVNYTYTPKGDLNIILDPSLPSGAYRLFVTKDSVMIYISDSAGASHAFATLLQIINTENNSTELVMIPDCEITDQSDYSYRGMMVDLARNWHDFSYLLSYVDMCYFYKASTLHLHFTDDQSYTLPSVLFPNLSTEGRHYTLDQISKLIEYAYMRGIELIPEIDVPGHCIIFQQTYPEIFGTTGIICQHKKSIDSMQALLSELCDMFSYSSHIHIGGDEAEIRNWKNCPECMNYAKDTGIDTSIEDEKLLLEHLYANFINKMADAVFAKKKTPIVWEGFAKEVNDLVSKDILVMSWENYYQIAPDLLEAGFKVINCSWNPMYIVAPETHWTQKELFNWSVYRWSGVHPQSPYKDKILEIEPTDQVIGGQLHAWGDTLAQSFSTVEEGVFVERELLLERLPMLAENTWNRVKSISFEDFIAKYQSLGKTITKILASYNN